MPKSTETPSKSNRAKSTAAKKPSARPSASRGSTRAPATRSTARKPAGSAKRGASKSGGVLAGATRQWGLKRLSIDRQLDIGGVFLALVGLLTLLSLLSSNHNPLTGWLVAFVNRLAGWGSFILPVTFILIGVWLVLRNVERLPMLSAERLTGVTLLYLNVLTGLHLLGGGGWALAEAGLGGGFVGAGFEWLLVGALGTAGAWIVVASWLLIAIALSLDVSITELFSFLQKVLASLARRANHQLENHRSEQENLAAENAGAGPPARARILQDLSAPQPAAPPPSSALPPDFHPLQTPANTGANTSTLPAPAAAPEGSAARARRAGAHAAPANSAGEAAQARVEQRPPAPTVPWKLPDIADILDPASLEVVKSSQDAQRGELIVETLKSFGTPVRIVEVSRGPTVTQFGVEPLYVETRSGRTRVRVSKIVALADDLALALAAPRIRIQAPVPGRNYVGIEVPNLEVSRVVLREVMESEAFKKIRSPMRFALGKDVAGNSKAYDLAAMPHLLIAGTTGSGKSVMVNSILSCLLLNNSPADLRMILVDPKRVELTGYNGIPHLLAPVVVEAEQVVGALMWVQREMDARYHRFAQVGARNIVDYNSKNSPTLPYMLVLIDELADLMMLAPDETERSLSRLAQLARATGIHLTLATQRPSVDVVTGLIKANFPARIAFAVASGIDSRVILDQPGAERLLGRGDMLFQAPDAAAPVRVQGAWVSDAEIQRIIDYWRTQAYEMRNLNTTTATATPVNMDMPLNAPLKQVNLFAEGDDRPNDPLIGEATAIVRKEGKASISMLQRKLRIGYTRAARLVDQMEEKGIIGPSQSTSQVREVFGLEAKTGGAEEINEET